MTDYAFPLTPAALQDLRKKLDEYKETRYWDHALYVAREVALQDALLRHAEALISEAEKARSRTSD